MVSFHTPLSPTRRNTIPELENLTKKRKWEESQAEEAFEKPIKAKDTKSMFDTELHLETPLPLEWQRCLDIKSGQIHYYNTRTQKRTSKDPRISPEPAGPGHMSLDLELNLPCGSSLWTNNHIDGNNSGSSSNNSGHAFLNCGGGGKNKRNSEGLTRSPSWLAFEGDQVEMVTAVCKKCHILVLMSKSSPACPNCKFMHPPDQSPPNLFKRRHSLLY